MTDTREPFEYVECDMRSCNRVYGVTCNAALGVTGDEKCFNTRASCQDPASFDRIEARRFESAGDVVTLTGERPGFSFGFTLVAIFKRDTVGAGQHFLFDLSDASVANIAVRGFLDGDAVRMDFIDSGGNVVNRVQTLPFFDSTDDWYLFAGSFYNQQYSVFGQNLTDTARRTRGKVIPVSGSGMDLSGLDTVNVGADRADGNVLDGGIALLYVNADEYVDWSRDDNVQRVVSGNGVLQDLSRGVLEPANGGNGSVLWLLQGNADDFLVNRSADDGPSGAAFSDGTASTNSTTDDSPFVLAGTIQTLTLYPDTLRRPRNVEGFPYLVTKGVKITPSIIKPNEGMGVRASVAVNLVDAPHHDIGIDPYVDDRAYDPLQQGTFWGKFLARNPYYIGQPLRVYRGRIEGDLFVQETLQHYRIETMAGPSGNGQFQITGKDLLKLADNDRAKAPREATAALSADLTDVATTFTVQPAGAGGNYDVAGYVRINSEVMAFTRDADTFTVTRGDYGTEAAAHGLDDSVQECYSFAADVGQTPQAIVYDLLVNYVDSLPPDAIDLAEWNAQSFDFVYQGIVTEPEGVRDLVNELAEQAGFYLWTDDERNTIRFHKIRPVGPNALTIDDAANRLTKGTTPKMADKLRVSAVTVYFGQRDPTEDLEKKSNYRGVQTVFADSFDATKYPDARIKEVFSRWIIQAGRASARDTARRITQRFGETPLTVEFPLHVKDKLTLGDLFLFKSRLTPTFTGAPGTRGLLTLEAEEAERGTTRRVVALQERYAPPPPGEERIVEYTVGDSFNRNARDDHDAIYLPAVGGEIVRFLIPAGAFIGSTVADLPAFDVGDWPASVTVIVEVVGRVQGKGGDGGDTAFSPGPTAFAGKDGGTAFYARRPITLIYSSGEIFAGGGGGGGGFNEFPGGGFQGGLGGGGGGGTAPGLGGIPAPSFPEPESANGRPGTKDAGGAGGTRNDGTGSGGTGGAPGQPGTQGTGYNAQAGFFPGADGGSEGLSIDGIAFVTVSGAAGDLRGPTA